MSKESNIGWTDATANFWVGCQKVSEGCKFCYMFRDYGGRYKKDPTIVTRTKPGTFNAALTWKSPKKIFTCSWSDFFIESADEFRDDAWDVIRRTPHHTWQILTKRPERILACLPDDWGEGWKNVWLGVSIENQKRSDERVEIFREIPAAVKFISVEPILEHIDLAKWMSDDRQIVDWVFPKIDWVIVGGESGNATGPWKYRNCEIEWIKSVVDQCRESAVPVFVKQLGTALARREFMTDKSGADPDEWGDLLCIGSKNQIQQFPLVKE